MTDDGSVHQYQVLVLADDLHHNYNYLPGLEKMVNSNVVPVNGLTDVDLCAKQGKYHEKS